MNCNSFSYIEYEQILNDIRDTGKYCDFIEAKNRDSFIVIRHDVEFSPAMALTMSKIEDCVGLKSTYNFQLTNNAYNVLSLENKKIIHDIASRGHKIGFHYHYDGEIVRQDTINNIKMYSWIFEMMLDFKIDRYSIHRPKRSSIEEEIKIPDMINLYGSDFFYYTEDINDSIPIKYLADSSHTWKYGYPSRGVLNSFDKIQLSIHPYSWSYNGYQNLENFKNLLNDRNEEFIQTLSSESKNFTNIKDHLF